MSAYGNMGKNALSCKVSIMCIHMILKKIFGVW